MKNIIKTAPFPAILYLAVAGVLFSGYLSAVKLFSQTCAIDRGCSYFLGYPTCYYGFGFFVLILLSALAVRFCHWGGQRMYTARLHFLRTVTALGILFSLYFSAIEIYAMVVGRFVYGAFILPTCFYGLLVYLAVFYLSWRIPKNAPVAQTQTTHNEPKSLV